MKKISLALFKLLNKKQIFLIFITFFFALLVSFIEIIGLGSLAIFVTLLNDISVIIAKVPIVILKNYLLTLDKNNIIILFSVILILIFTLKTILLILFNLLMAKVQLGIQHTISKKLIDKYLDKDYEFFLTTSSIELINKINIEVTRFATFIFAVIYISKDLILLLFLILGLVSINLDGTLIIFFFIFLFSFLIYLSLKGKVKKIGKEQTIYRTALYNILSQMFNGIKTVKILTIEKFFNEKFFKNLRLMLRNTLQIRIINPLPRIILELIAVVGICLIIIRLNYLNTDFAIILPTLTFLALTIIRMIPAFASINQNVNHMLNNAHAADIITRDLDDNSNESKISYKDPFLKQKKIILDVIQLKDINFKYKTSKNLILKDISFNLKKNDTLGIIGNTGSGKSTLGDLILGLIKPINGEILINNDNKLINSSSFKKIIGYVPQDIYLIDDSIKNNIAIGIDEKLIDDEKINASLKAADLFDFVQTLPDKTNTQIGERGVRISGGQRQRLGIARTLYREPQIILLDEATSALDSETEKKVIKNIEQESKDKIIVMIAHRISTLRNCNKLMIINEGRIEDFGDVDDVLKKNEFLIKFFDK